MPEGLGDEIARLVISTFNSTKLKGKPVIKSNGIKEWTVLAGIVAVHQTSSHEQSLDLITLTTGVKTLPEETIKISNGLLLHDCHAEILSLRAFNRFIIDECLKAKSTGRSSYIEETQGDEIKGKFKLREGIKFSMYISELPCGDCSLDSQVEGTEEQFSWDDFTELDGGVIRGREGFGSKGRVRTKPGRRDSPLSLSKSCSDKLCLTQWTSLLNGLIANLLVDPAGFHLEWLIIPEDKFHENGLKRCFRERFETTETITLMKFTKTSLHHDWENNAENQIPSNSSVVYVPSLDLQESIVNSVKEGFYTKSKKPRKNGESQLSRSQLYKQASPLINIESSLTYLELKATNHEYKRLKSQAQEALGNWCKTTTDDFNIYER